MGIWGYMKANGNLIIEGILDEYIFATIEI